MPVRCLSRGGGTGGWRAGLIAGLLLIALIPTAFADPADFQRGAALIAENRFASLEEGVALVAASGDPQARKLLLALQGSDLYLRKSDRTLVVAARGTDGYDLLDPLTGEPAGSVASKRELKRVRINNRLRSQLRSAIAGLDLSHPDPAVRLSGVTEMIANLDAEGLDLLRARMPNEPDAEVREAMTTAIALGDLESPDPEARIASLAELKGTLHPAVRGSIRRLIDTDPDPEVRQAAQRATDSIEFKLQLYSLAETLFFGLSLGSVLVLAAIGLAITFGVMGVINMAHGELIMLGAYTTYIVQQLMPDHIGASVLIAVPAAFLVSGAVGILIERGVIRFLYGRPLETLLATFGISLVLQQLVRTLISPQNVPVANPEWMSGAWQINSVLSLTMNRMVIIAFCLIVFAALYLVMRRTALGLQVRAVSQNRAMARAMGVRSARVDALTFGLGSGIAGVAGVALSQLTNVGPNLGQSYIIDSFMVVVFGGVGNLWGTLVAGMSLGVVNKFLEPWAGAVLAKILVLVFIILFIQKRPRGLFPQKGRAAEA
ncbi:urea ABC transporter permease subunit UrtB [Imhoffiella purpurea]|uniref:Urea ABC transporter, permease protein UrtB n=1 Tax=Imhoffiella purpurea TaxID=1249627 RepID=W9VBC1_9GAMM|nr:urea ABC transporter permease subunit UrtB [Imhoffiella purpurea]EXJ16744.1 Urea ABC transporter, permease protein UrtB [Imhoffiella purpurea]